MTRLIIPTIEKLSCLTQDGLELRLDLAELARYWNNFYSAIGLKKIDKIPEDIALFEAQAYKVRELIRYYGYNWFIIIPEGLTVKSSELKLLLPKKEFKIENIREPFNNSDDTLTGLSPRLVVARYERYSDDRSKNLKNCNFSQISEHDLYYVDLVEFLVLLRHYYEQTGHIIDLDKQVRLRIAKSSADYCRVRDSGVFFLNHRIESVYEPMHHIVGVYRLQQIDKDKVLPLPVELNDPKEAEVEKKENSHEMELIESASDSSQEKRCQVGDSVEVSGKKFRENKGVVIFKNDSVMIVEFADFNGGHDGSEFWNDPNFPKDKKIPGRKNFWKFRLAGDEGFQLELLK
jgi:hypothetical protein